MIVLRPDPHFLAAAYYDSRKVGYLAREKQAIWDEIKHKPHQVKVIGKLSHEDGSLTGLAAVEVSTSEDVNEQLVPPVVPSSLEARINTFPILLTGIVALLVFLAPVVVIKSIGLRFGEVKQTTPNSDSVSQLAQPAEWFQDIATKEEPMRCIVGRPCLINDAGYRGTGAGPEASDNMVTGISDPMFQTRN